MFKNLSLFSRFLSFSPKRTMSQKPILYGDEVSPPFRFVVMTASLLNVDLEIRNIELFKGENRTEEYAKINPLKKIPALVVGENKILDSHAAAIYLCDISGNYEFYPTEPTLRAKVNELMFYNTGTIFRMDASILLDCFSGKWPIAESRVEEWNAALDYLDAKLEKSPWLVGDKMYLCDMCIMTTIASLNQLFPLTDRHKNIKRWFEQFKEFPISYEVTKRGGEKLKNFLEFLKTQKAK